MSNYAGGVLNRRKRASDRNERQLKVVNENIEEINRKMDRHEKEPSFYNADDYKILIQQGISRDYTRIRLEKEIETLKNRI